MKIAVFTDSYRPYVSGVVHSIDTFKTELEALGHEIYIFAPAYPHHRDAREMVFRFFSLPAPTNKDFTLAIPFHGRLKSVLQAWRPDLVHVHSPFLLGSLGARQARRLQKPLVFTFHTLYEEYVHYFPFARGAAKKVTRLIAKNFCNRCDLVIAPTPAIQGYLQDIGVQAPVKSIPTGINLPEYSGADRDWLRRQYRIPEEEKILLFVGRLGQEKNVGFLLEAFVQVHRKFSPVRLFLVGGGPEEKALRDRVEREGLARRVIFTGKIPKEAVAAYYAGADLFVFASVTETQGLVIAEAKAAGLPAVAVKAFGACAMVNNGQDGFLTELNLDEFVEKILVLLNNERQRAEFARQARLNAAGLSARNCALQLLESYQVLLEKSSPGKENII